MIVVVASFMFLAYPSPRSHISKTLGFFAVIVVLKLSEVSVAASISLAVSMLIHRSTKFCIFSSGFYASRRSRRRDMVKLTVCVCVCVCLCVCSSCNCSTVVMRRKLTASIGF